MTPGPAGSSWTFLTNHGHVLICIAADPQTRMRDVAQRIGITERAVQRIVAELEADGYVRVTRVGRRNRYEVNAELPLRHPIQDHRTIGHLVELGLGGKPKKK
jgi:Mn-dependent DtxR family transcriptional regulator